MSATQAPIWHGTSEEQTYLLAVIAAWCECDPTLRTTCCAHKMITEQRVLDGLLWSHRLRRQLLLGEFNLVLPHKLKGD